MATKTAVLTRHQSTESTLIWSRELSLILAATLIAHANIAVFFQFYEHLKTLPIDPKWFGFLIGTFSAVCLVVRPVISSLFHAANACRYLFVGTALVAVSLASYSLAQSFLPMLLVRAFHGLGFTVLGTALTAITVHHIPPGKSGRAFGLLGIIVLIPNVFVPPLLPFLTKSLGTYSAVLSLFAVITIIVFPVIRRLNHHRAELKESPPLMRLTGKDIFAELRKPRIMVIITAMLIFYSTYALIFYFLDGYCRSIGIENPGLFLTLALATEIGIRLLAGPFFDRMPKPRLISFTLLGLAASYLALGHIADVKGFLLLAVLVGLGWGVAMPVFNGLMFDSSTPRLRAFNVNLGLHTFQGGLFIGPIIGAPIAASFGFSSLFPLCALLCLVSAGMVFCLATTSASNPRMV